MQTHHTSSFHPPMFVSARRIVAVLLMTGLAATGYASQASAREKGSIKFARGSSSKTVSGTARSTSADCWNFDAESGQRASFRVSGTSVIGLFVFDGDPYYGDPAGGDQFDKFGTRADSQDITSEGPFRVCVLSTSARSRSYKLTLTIV